MPSSRCPIAGLSTQITNSTNLACLNSMTCRVQKNCISQVFPSQTGELSVTLLPVTIGAPNQAMACNSIAAPQGVATKSLILSDQRDYLLCHWLILKCQWHLPLPLFFGEELFKDYLLCHVFTMATTAVVVSEEHKTPLPLITLAVSLAFALCPCLWWGLLKDYLLCQVIAMATMAVVVSEEHKTASVNTQGVLLLNQLLQKNS